MKRRNITTTPRELAKYNQIISRKYFKQKLSVLRFLKESETPQCMRQIEAATSVPVYTICRIIRHFEKAGVIENKYDGKSQLSGFPSVHHYGLSDKRKGNFNV
ncbi:MarR family transcriptional regulator [Sphingobacterium sp. CZ-2]|uniref:MarR family transcriptional regulator n=1 Tax=Sphingobacterium sp. CZ-2 TaxID=2557994 RepID=UPI001431D9BF|nr:MarR family transcriptional regulator [Sphingobacterium sp. CZ-2]